ncbi:hypothetical protein [Bauldia litoralis]|uniref:Uncharacterized protein n=1 Tax=Bauldia litoralis TaxID=665467 RepID=A0A1G6CWP8_9HYPH|nr:hypothetical protein [Bauldia litoralis]SDB37258.1 hypothetical protein SAMN02982931_02846 [Bauldia litoralis]
MLRFDPAPIFLELAAFLAALRVPPASPMLAVDAVKPHDRHVVRAAVELSACVLTMDAELAVGCQELGLAVTFPWAVVVELGDNAQVREAEVLRLAPLSQRRGIIFARTTPGGWAGMSNVGTFTVVDVENLGRLAFDSSTAMWVFTCSLGFTMRLPYPPAGDQTTVVSVAFNVPGAGHSGSFVLRAGRLGADDKRVVSRSTLKTLAVPFGGMRIGSSQAGTDFWNGYLRHIVTAPTGIQPKTWQAILQVEDAAPNPMSDNALDLALQRLNQR